MLTYLGRFSLLQLTDHITSYMSKVWQKVASKMAAIFLNFFLEGS
jgi:hypothetical protein